MTTSSINISALDNLIGAMARCATNAATAKTGCSGPMTRVWADTACLSSVDTVVQFVTTSLPDLRRRLALAQHIEASEPGFQNYVQFNDNDLPTDTPAQAAAKGKEIAEKLKNNDLDPELLAALEKGQYDPYFAKALAENISPAELATYVTDMSNQLRSKQGSYDPEDAKKYLEQYGAMLKGLGSTLGLATRGNGDLALPPDYAKKWIEVLTQSTGNDVGNENGTDPDHYGPPWQASGLAALLGEGRFGTGFTLELTRAVMAHEKQFGQVRIWSLRAHSGGTYTGAYDAEGNQAYDPLTGLMAAIAKDPVAGTQLFGTGERETIEVDGKKVEVNSLVRYLITQRRWPTDGGQNLSDALMTAMTPFEGGPISSAQIQRDAYHVSKAFQKEIEDRTKDHGPLSTFGHFLLDVVGLIPLVGEVADGLNAVWYAAEGDVVNAGLSAAGAIPVVGWVAVGGKWVKKTLTAADIARLGLKWRDLPKDAPRALKLLAIGKGVDSSTFLFHSEKALAKAMDSPHPGITYRIAHKGQTTNYVFDAAGNLSVVRGTKAGSRGDVPTIPSVKVEEILKQSEKNGATLPNHRGNRPYSNDPTRGEAKLPGFTPAGGPIKYTEYYVSPNLTKAQKQAGLTTDGKRILKGDDGSVWYTDDHYSTMVRVK